MKKKLSKEQIQKNKNITRLLHQACCNNDFYSLSKLTKETEVLTSLTSKELMFESREMYQIGNLAKELLKEINKKQKQIDKSPFLTKINRIAKAGRKNNAIINWVIYELSKFCKKKTSKNRIVTDWDEIADILTGKDFKQRRNFKAS